MNCSACEEIGHIETQIATTYLPELVVLFACGHSKEIVKTRDFADFVKLNTLRNDLAMFSGEMPTSCLILIKTFSFTDAKLQKKQQIISSYFNWQSTSDLQTDPCIKELSTAFRWKILKKQLHNFR